jgi:hypothetical protein
MPLRKFAFLFKQIGAIMVSYAGREAGAPSLAERLVLLRNRGVTGGFERSRCGMKHLGGK